MAEHVLEPYGIRYETHPDVYVPSNDTLLLLDAVDLLPAGRLIEVGTGTGVVSIAAARTGRRPIATDLNPEAVRLARRNAARNAVRVDVVRADLFQGIDAAASDAIVFNPPYLPTLPSERLPGPLNWAFDGGPDGRAVARRFLSLLPPSGPPAFMVATSLQGLDELVRIAATRGRTAQAVRERRIPYERLVVMRFDAAPTRKG